MSDAIQKKNFFFSKLLLVANNFRVISIAEGVGVLFFLLQSVLEKHLERETNIHSKILFAIIQKEIL